MAAVAVPATAAETLTQGSELAVVVTPAKPKPNHDDALQIAQLPAHVDGVLPEHGQSTQTINRYWGLCAAESELVSTSITQTWTEQSIKCYLTCADCESCSIPRGGYAFACQMAKVVPALLATIGTPDEDRIEKMVPVLDRY